MVRIRLKRTGTKNLSCFRVVVMDQKSTRDGRSIEEIGFYDPRHDEERLNLERYNYWVGMGARPSESVTDLARRLSDPQAEEKRKAAAKKKADAVAKAKADEEKKIADAKAKEEAAAKKKAEEEAKAAEKAEAAAEKEAAKSETKTEVPAEEKAEEKKDEPASEEKQKK